MMRAVRRYKVARAAQQDADTPVRGAGGAHWLVEFAEVVDVDPYSILNPLAWAEVELRAKLVWAVDVDGSRLDPCIVCRARVIDIACVDDKVRAELLQLRAEAHHLGGIVVGSNSPPLTSRPPPLS